MAGRQSYDLIALIIEERIGGDYERTRFLLNECRESWFEL